MQENAELLADYQLRGAFSSQPRRFSQSLLSSAIFMQQGHILGVTFEKGSTDCTSAFGEANDALDEVLGLRTLLALVPGARTPLLCRGIAFLKPKICWYL